MHPEHLAGSPVELLEVAKTASGSNHLLHALPEAFDGVEVVPTAGGNKWNCNCPCQCSRVGASFFGPMDTTAIDDHHDFFSSFAEDGHHLMKILPEVLGIKIGHDFIEDACGPILHGANDVEQYPAGDPAPGAIAQPCLAFQALVAFDLTRAQRPCGQTRALGFPPPARPREGKMPEDGLIFIEQNDLATASLVLQGGEFKGGIREGSRVGIKASGGAVVTYLFFFNAQRTLSRPSWTPVCCANTVASSRQLHWGWREPCCSGS